MPRGSLSAGETAKRAQHTDPLRPVLHPNHFVAMDEHNCGPLSFAYRSRVNRFDERGRRRVACQDLRHSPEEPGPGRLQMGQLVARAGRREQVVGPAVGSPIRRIVAPPQVKLACAPRLLLREVSLHLDKRLQYTALSHQTAAQGLFSSMAYFGPPAAEWYAACSE